MTLRTASLTTGFWAAAASLAMLLAGCDMLVPPVPIDPPEPPVIVEPIANVSWAIVLYESSDLTPEQSVLKADPFWQTVKSRWYDVDSPDAVSAVKATEGLTRPTLLLIDGKGRKLWAGPLPSEIETIKQRIRGAA